MNKYRRYWTGTKVKLRFIEPKDIDSIVVRNKDRDFLADRSNFFVPYPENDATVRGDLERIMNEAPKDDKCFLAICDLDDNICGTINTHNVSRLNGSFYYGISIFEDKRGFGYGKEAVLLLIRYFFMELRYHKMICGVFSFNDASKALQESLGFKLEGVITGAHYSDGKYYDELVYGMTIDEYKELYE